MNWQQELQLKLFDGISHTSLAIFLNLLLAFLAGLLISSILSENLPTKREKVWTNCGSICTFEPSDQKNVLVKSA